MNAMSVFRDQCAVSWDVNTFTSGGTIAPATVITHIETAAPEYDMIARSGINSEQKKMATQDNAQSNPSARQKSVASQIGPLSTEGQFSSLARYRSNGCLQGLLPYREQRPHEGIC